MLTQVKNCPNCGSQKSEKVFSDTKYDNDLHEFGTNNVLAKKYPGINFDELAQSSFSICQNCLLVYATNRRKEETMYSMDFFADVQKRWYAKYPLPQKYIEQHKKLAENFIDILDRGGFSLSQKPKVLWLRSECGILAMDLLKNVDKDCVYIMEYFDSNIKFLKEHGFKNVQPLPPGDFKNPFKGTKFTEIFLNHQLIHSFNPLGLTKSILDMLDNEGKIILYNEINHIESNKSGKHYPRGVNSFHNQLFTKNSLSNLLKTANASIEFFEPLNPLSNASVNFGMFGIIKKNLNNSGQSTYVNSKDLYYEELNSFRSWMQKHKKFKKTLAIKALLHRIIPYKRLKRVVKAVFIKLGLWPNKLRQNQ